MQIRPILGCWSPVPMRRCRWGHVDFGLQLSKLVLQNSAQVVQVRSTEGLNFDSQVGGAFGPSLLWCRVQPPGARLRLRWLLVPHH
eukprot:Skav214054  [mRNA]  locus=scaffold2017:444789:449073:+ [translate_table: standard]